jgi:excisionase family DNA binding protein
MSTLFTRPAMPKIDQDANSDRLVYDVPEAGALLGLTRNGSYEAAKRGDIPTIRIGGLIKVPKAAFHRMLDVPVAKAS